MGDSDSRSRSRSPRRDDQDKPGRSASPAKSRSKSPSNLAAENGDEIDKNIRVRGLTRNVNAAHLQEIFSTFGAVEKVEVAVDEKVDLPRGFADIVFANKDDAAKAIEYMHRGQIDGKYVTVMSVREARQVVPNRGREEPKREYGGGHKGRRSPSPRRSGGSPRQRYDRRRSPPRHGWRRSRSPDRRRSYSPVRRSRSPPPRGRSPPRKGRRSPSYSSSPSRSYSSYSFSRSRSRSSSRSRSYSSRSRSRSRSRGRSPVRR